MNRATRFRLIAGAVATAVLYVLAETPANAQPVFPTPLIELTTSSFGAVAADLDEDGRRDLAVSSWSTQGGIDLLFGRGDGTFEPRTRLFAGTDILGVASADFNDDGHADLAAGADSGLVRIFLGHGNGTFAPPTGYGTAFHARTLLTGDLDRDGRLDVLVLHGGSFLLSWLRGRGDGTFDPELRSSVQGSGIAGGLADLDQDGLLDLAVIEFGGVASYRGRGDGTFVFQSRFVVGLGFDAWDLHLADVNGDGRVDVAGVDQSSDSVTIALGRGDASFGIPRSYAVGDRPIAVRFVDTNGDGRLDLTTANASSGDVSLLPGLGDGFFGPATHHPTGNNPWAAVASDLDHDGRGDLLVLGFDFRIATFLGTESGVFDGVAAYRAGDLNANDRWVATIDLDSDGATDLLSADRTGQVLQYLPGRGDGTFEDARTIAPTVFPTRVIVGRFDSDALEDILVLDSNNAGMKIWPGRGDGTVGSPITTVFNFNPRTALPVDFNGDQRLDLAIGGPLTGQVTILLGRGDGRFDAAASVTVDGSPATSVAADFNGDGRPDLAVHNEGRDEVSVFLGHGDGSFGPGVRLVPGGRTYAIDAADLNGDGRADVAVLAQPGGGVHRLVLYPGRGDGTFDPRVDLPELFGNAIAHADVNADGRVDLLVTGFSDLMVLLANGEGGFHPATRFLFGFGVRRLSGPIALGDFNRDGRTDVAGNISIYGVGVALNRGGALDLDGDGIVNGFDPCTDIDGDGLGDPRFAASICPPDPCPRGPENDVDSDARCGDVDNCPLLYNPLQQDGDFDHVGDACDVCIDTPDPGQANRDGDDYGDACDRCPSVASSDQTDSNGDGSGDACQPLLELRGILEDGGDALEVRARATDPQGDPLSGRMEVIALEPTPVALPDALAAFDCSAGYSPDGTPGAGIGFAFGSLGDPYLFDLDSVLVCQDAQADWLLAPGSCDHPAAPFDPYLLLTVLETNTVCLRRAVGPARDIEFTIEAYDLDTLHGHVIAAVIAVEIPFASGLPRVSDIPGLEAGRTHRLEIRATDGDTVPVTAFATFTHRGESVLVINHPPDGVASAPAFSECAGPDGTAVTLDGSASADIDSIAQEDDIVAHDWFLDLGPAGIRPLGGGSTLTTLFPLGEHRVILRVTDRFGESGEDAAPLRIGDTLPPALVCPAATGAECSAPDGTPVALAGSASDVCDPAPTLTNSLTGDGGDASAAYPLGATTVVFTARDAAGASATCTTQVTVADTQPPQISAALEPPILWPPNHRLVPVEVSWEMSDRCDPAATVTLVAATSSEPDDAAGAGDGQTQGDIEGALPGTPDTGVLLRAERMSGGPGRTYELTYRVADSSGNRSERILRAFVPNDLGQGPDPLLLRVEPIGGEGAVRIAWPEIDGAAAYDVIVGELSQVRVEAGTLSLGAVSFVARATTATAAAEPPGAAIPKPGEAFFYLAQWHGADGPSGYGTAPAPLPSVPASCAGGCP